MKNSRGERVFILIIEDGVGKMDAVHKSLQKAGCEHGFAKTREDAIRIMVSKIFDFVIMDYVMPGMSGEEFKRVIGANNSKAKIIFTFSKTGVSPETDIKDCQWLGVPFDSGELLNLLQNGAHHNGS
jgi:CheY-like chemotaxis protein